MAKLKRSDQRIIDEALGMTGSYVLDFSNRTFAEFFEDEFGIEIYGGSYDGSGGSKASHLRAFIEAEDAATIARVLRRLGEHGERLPLSWNDTEEARAQRRTRFHEVLAKVESDAPLASTDGIDRFARSETLEELVASIERDILADRPEVALGHLHTYCAKKMGHLLDVRGIAWERSEPLHSRAGKYVKAIAAERQLSEMTMQIAKTAISTFDKFNGVRNTRTLVHDNVLLERAEARFVFDSVSAFLRFVKAIEAGRFEANDQTPAPR